MHTVMHLAPNAHEIPRETYLPRRKGDNFEDFKCPFGCNVHFFSKAALHRHRVRMHKFKRSPKDVPEEKFEIIPIFDDVKKIIKRASSESKEFVVETDSGSFVWRTLPLDDDRVKEFISKSENEAAPELPLVNVEVWVDGGELIDFDVAEEKKDDK